MPKKTEFSTDEIFRKIDTSLEQTDRLRADNLDKMATVQQVREKALTKERQRLSVKYGADDVRVQRIDAKLQFTQGFTQDLKVEIDKANIQVPTVDRNTWMVHGRVLQTKDSQGIPKLTVSLVNREGKWLQDLGYACTDERGYFAIIYPPKDSQSPTPPPKEPIFLMVSDANQRTLYRSKEPLLVKPGETIYREIFLSGDGECPPPPDSETPAVPVKILSLDGPAQLKVNESGTFTAKINEDATPPLTYSWDFDDKTTPASTLTAAHSYASARIYTVTFTAANPNTASQSLKVTVRGETTPPTIENLSANPSNPQIYSPVQFSATVGGDAPISCAWNFGDNSTSPEVTPSHTYQKPGTYTVKMTAANDGGSASQSLSLNVSELPRDVWMVRGRVVDTKGVGVGGLLVSLFDSDMIFDDRLGTTETDAEGNFVLYYRTEDFRDLFEARPDLYIKVMDGRGNILYSSRQAVRYEAGRVEEFDVIL